MRAASVGGTEAAKLARVPAVLPSQIDRLEQHEIPSGYDPAAIRRFLAATTGSSGAELANAQSILNDLCDVLHVPRPALKKAAGDNAYVFEEDVKEGKAHRRVDLYRRGCFVFEAKQGVNAQAPAAETKPKAGHTKKVKGAGVRDTTDWIDNMQAGRAQAGNYAAQIAERGDPKPPFLIVADLGYRFWIWSSFSRDARDDYGAFEVLAAFAWEDIGRPEVWKLLRQIWLEPAELNEEARGQRVTAEIAARVGKLAARLDKRFPAEEVGDFLMKCVFTMFAEDVGFLPLKLFTDRLEAWRREAQDGHPEMFVRGLKALWTRMRDGGDLDSGHPIRQFNGYLFRDPTPLALDYAEIDELWLAAKQDWRKVSPAIFGTLLERALSEKKRQRLGAFYTPEAYIRRLVEKTIMAPLREEWTTVRALMESDLRGPDGVKKGRAKALERGHAFRKRLTDLRVLDPACGSGNFLYVALKEMKRLEGEVTRALTAMGNKQTWFDMPGEAVHPAQFYGIEIEPWAAKIAELTLWIGYLQWQVSANRLQWMRDPLLQDLRHIANDDALITYTGKEAVRDEQGKPVLRVRGVTDKKGERIMVPVERLVGVKRAAWPAADFIVGNPPFLGNKRLNDVLDPGYVDAIREAYPEIPGTADLVMFWWWRCAELLHEQADGSDEPTAAKKRFPKKAASTPPGGPKLRAFGLVTTNSITQKFNRGVVVDALANKGVKLAYAIPDHPWFDEGAAVRIAMTVGSRRVKAPVVGTVTNESRTKAAELDLVKVDEKVADGINVDLSTGAEVRSASVLQSNKGLCFQGITLVGEGFRLSREDLARLGETPRAPVLKPYLIGRDLVQRREDRWVIDFFGLSATEASRQYPALFEHLVREVKPQRERQNDRQRKEKWWLFGRSGSDLRAALASLSRYIATSRTAKHRIFTLVPADTLPDTKIVAIALEDPTFLALLSSRVHLAWADRTKAMLEDRPTYNHTESFEPFPFPSLTPVQAAALQRAGERLDAHRKARQAEHPTLTLTDTYNVIAKLRTAEALDAEEQQIRDMALADTLLNIHNEIDHLTLAAYGWPDDLSDDQIIARLVALNAERAAEEEKGIVRWLRPDYQAATLQGKLPAAEEEAQAEEAPEKPKKRPAKASALPWPSDLPGRIQALTTLLRDYAKENDEPVEARFLAMMFKGAKLDEVELTLQCAAAADAVARTENDAGEVAWMARAT
jgi:hypothetical protein